MTITPTQADREAAARIARHMCIRPDGVPPRAIEEGHPAGDASSLVQAFARHAAKARAEGMEAAAVIADDTQYGEYAADGIRTAIQEGR